MRGGGGGSKTETGKRKKKNNVCVADSVAVGMMVFFFSHLAVRLCLLPLHLAELSLKSLVLIGQHLESVLQCRAFLLVPTDLLTVYLVLQLGKEKVESVSAATSGGAHANC